MGQACAALGAWLWGLCSQGSAEWGDRAGRIPQLQDDVPSLVAKAGGTEGAPRPWPLWVESPVSCGQNFRLV